MKKCYQAYKVLSKYLIYMFHLSFCFIIVLIFYIPFYSSPQRPRGTLHLDDGEYWSNRAASYKGKSHRPIFENSMDKIYRNLYKKACSSVSHTQESFWDQPR